jgi:hypothetical protein
MSRRTAFEHDLVVDAGMRGSGDENTHSSLSGAIDM